MVFKQHHFVLVHGAGHGAWCWVNIFAVLEKAGHRVTTVDLVSAGLNTVLADDVSSLEQYDQPLKDLLASIPDPEKVILVGHSLGGMNLTRMSELFPKKISVAIYLAAFMLSSGQDLTAMRVSDPQFLPTAGYDLSYHSKVEGGPVTSLEFPFEALRDFFYNKCSPEDRAFAVSKVKRFPLLPSLLRPIFTTEENYGSVRRVYILATHDRVTDPISARKMIELNAPDEVYEIDADHSPFFSAVEVVEKILIGTAAKYDFHPKPGYSK